MYGTNVFIVCVFHAKDHFVSFLPKTYTYGVSPQHLYYSPASARLLQIGMRAGSFDLLYMWPEFFRSVFGGFNV